MPDSTIRVLQTRHGPMVVFRNDQFVTRCLDAYGEYSPGEWRLLKQLTQPGATIVEVGANIGALTIPLAKRCHPGRLYAFEPQQRVFQVLCANLALNDLVNVVARPEACGENEGEAVMRTPDFKRMSNFGAGSISRSDSPGDPVRVVTVDGLQLDKLDLLKIDVEGFEPQVLRGARRTVDRCRPTIYCENDRAEHQEEVINLLNSMGYRIFWHVPPLVDDKVEPNIFNNRFVSVNVLALPNESTRECQLPQIDPDNWTSPLRKTSAT